MTLKDSWIWRDNVSVRRISIHSLFLSKVHPPLLSSHEEDDHGDNPGEQNTSSRHRTCNDGCLRLATRKASSTWSGLRGGLTAKCSRDNKIKFEFLEKKVFTLLAVSRARANGFHTLASSFVRVIV